MLGAACLQALFRPPPSPDAEDVASEEQRTRAAAGAMLLFEGIWHLRRLSGSELQIKIMSSDGNNG